MANELTSINVEPATIIDAGKVGNRRQGSLKLRFDPAEYLNTWTPEAVNESLEESSAVHPESMEGVLSRLPGFLPVIKSVLQSAIEARGHILMLSPKYHAELAGCGIEYCFGRTKWWYRNNNSRSAESLRANSLRSFDPEVLTIDHVRKFARRARDYMRAYRWGARGLDVETAIKKYKTHRSMLDIDFKFVSE